MERHRVMHNHGTQASRPIEVEFCAEGMNCPACKLIRPEVMHEGSIPYLRSATNIFGSPPTPEEW